MRCAVLLVALAATAAFADAPRVVIADRDPELHHAVETALAPWHVEVVDGDDATARVAITRDGDELIVEDRATGARERHAAKPGDPVAAAATALSVKTLLRLEQPEAPPPPASPPSGDDLRALLIGGGALGSTSVARGELAALWGGAFRYGVAGMFAGGASIDSASFKGSWAMWGVAAAASYAFAFDAWEVAPLVEVGFARATLDGTEGTTARTEHQTLLRIAAGATGMRRFGRFAAGLHLGFAATPGGDTYTKTTGMAAIFATPTASAEVGLVVSCDLFGGPGH